MITVEALDARTYRVTVSRSAMTSHEVTVDPAVAGRLAPNVPIERLLEASFEFLLEREPNTAILSRFDLPVIGRYFPEYEREICDRV